MGGNWIDDDWELARSSFVRTLVLVGRTGNGKSATANSILGRKAFKSMPSSNGVTSVCELESTISEDGLILNVIDTPGLFDFSADFEFVGREILKCINMAKDGIHAVLMVLSVRARFTREEEATIKSLQELFGNKILDYMVVVFAGGDDLEDNDKTLDDYLLDSGSLRNSRIILFDNKTRDKSKKDEQLNQLLSFVNQVMQNNGRKPYTNNTFTELKKEAKELHDQTANVNSLEGCSKQEILALQDRIHKTHEENMNQIAKMFEAKMKEAIERLEQQLAEEQAARVRAEERARQAHDKSDEEMRKLWDNFERSKRENAELHNRLAQNKCAIL